MNYFPSNMSGLTLPHQLNGYQKLQNTHHYVYIYLRVCVLFTGILHRGFPMCLRTNCWSLGGQGEGPFRWFCILLSTLRGLKHMYFTCGFQGWGKKEEFFTNKTQTPHRALGQNYLDHSGQLTFSQIFNLIKPLPSQCFGVLSAPSLVHLGF